MQAVFSTQTSNRSLNRAAFDCGNEALNAYFQKQVTQDVKRKVTNCFVLTNKASEVLGFYTLAACSLQLTDLTEETQKKVPRYPNVPAVRMGRFAITKTMMNQGLGGALLADALKRCILSDIAAYALVVDAKDETAAAFYKKFGFKELGEQALKLYLVLSATLIN